MNVLMKQNLLISTRNCQTKLLPGIYILHLALLYSSSNTSTSIREKEFQYENCEKASLGEHIPSSLYSNLPPDGRALNIELSVEELKSLKIHGAVEQETQNCHRDEFKEDSESVITEQRKAIEENRVKTDEADLCDLEFEKEKGSEGECGDLEREKKIDKKKEREEKKQKEKEDKEKEKRDKEREKKEKKQKEIEEKRKKEEERLREKEKEGSSAAVFKFKGILPSKKKKEPVGGIKAEKEKETIPSPLPLNLASSALSPINSLPAPLCDIDGNTIETREADSEVAVTNEPDSHEEEQHTKKEEVSAVHFKENQICQERKVCLAQEPLFGEHDERNSTDGCSDISSESLSARSDSTSCTYTLALCLLKRADLVLTLKKVRMKARKELPSNRLKVMNNFHEFLSLFKTFFNLGRRRLG